MTRNRLAAVVAASLSMVLVPARAQWWNPTDPTPPKYWGTEFAPKITYTHRTFLDAENAANGAFWNNEFRKLDRMYDELLRDSVRTIDGTMMVQAFTSPFENAGASPVFDKQMALWAQDSPQSKLRPLAQAIRLQGDAWRTRGFGAASSVPGEGWQIFREKLLEAANALKDAEPEGKSSPLWYWVALIVAGSSGRPSAQFDALFEEAVARFPLYQPLYYTRMNYLLPQWGGSFEDVERFVNQSIARTRGEEGDAFYAWLYMDVARKYHGNIFADGIASWPRMKKAFDDMIARHPDDWNKNLYASYACYVRDKETTGRLIGELGLKTAIGALPGITTESCRRFALTPA